MRSAVIKWLRFYFGISKTEANGVVVLFFIMTMISLMPVIIHYLSPVDGNAGIKQQQQLDSLVALLDSNLVPVATEPPDEVDSATVVYFDFDPNTADLNDFEALGLTQEVGNRIIKYREKGGVFRRKEDLSKIYGLSDVNFRTLSPYIVIQRIEDEVSENIQANRNENETLIKKPVLFDINIADSSELVIINGIGEVMAGRIIRFRNSLGGFVRIEQLKEVYGLEPYAFENLIRQSYIDKAFTPRKLSVNTITADSMARHPYIDYNEARVISAYRAQHGKFQGIEDLKEILVLDKSWIDRVSPYLEY